MRRTVLILHNVRSAHNVGSILRSADGFGVERIYLSGYTPYPLMSGDNRLPHVAKRVEDQISKTALGAEKTVKWQHETDVLELLSILKKEGFMLVALEQTDKAIGLPAFQAAGNVALIAGSEIGGITPKVLKAVQTHIAIPMAGNKKSFNVSVAVAVALYHLRWYNHKLDDR